MNAHLLNGWCIYILPLFIFVQPSKARAMAVFTLSIITISHHLIPFSDYYSNIAAVLADFAIIHFMVKSELTSLSLSLIGLSIISMVINSAEWIFWARGYSSDVYGVAMLSFYLTCFCAMLSGSNIYGRIMGAITMGGSLRYSHPKGRGNLLLGNDKV